MNTTLIAGVLQIDHERGVIYFHSDEKALHDGYCPTPLRICGLGNIEAPLGDRQIDITISHRSIEDCLSVEDREEINEARIIK